MVQVKFPRFYGYSHMTFEPLKNSYQTFQITVEFKVGLLHPAVAKRVVVFFFLRVCLLYRLKKTTACCCTAERTNTVVETSPHWLWCEGSCTTGEPYEFDGQEIKKDAETTQTYAAPVCCSVVFILAFQSYNTYN